MHNCLPCVLQAKPVQEFKDKPPSFALHTPKGTILPHGAEERSNDERTKHEMQLNFKNGFRNRFVPFNFMSNACNTQNPFSPIKLSST